MSNARIRIAWFVPLQVNKNGENVFSKSEYSSSLILPRLSDNFEIEIFSARAGQNLAGSKSRHYLTAWTLHKQKPFDIFFYNLENGRHCDFCRLHLALVPGITWLHDFTLIDDGPEPILNSPWIKFVEAFNRKDLDKIIWPSKLEEHLPKRPQAFREVGMSFFSMFSAERDLEQFRQLNPVRLNPTDRGEYLPLPVDCEFATGTKEGSSVSELKIATCCSPTVDSHIHCLLQSLSDSKDKKLIWLIDKSEQTKCKELIDEFDLEKVEFVIGRNSQAWIDIIKKSDLVFHCLHTFYEQSNPWLAIALAQGVFCMVLDFSESDYLPLNVAIKIAPGPSEVSQLNSVFESLLDSKKSIAATDFYNNDAKIFAKERFDVKALCQELELSLRKLSPLIFSLNKKWSEFLTVSRTNLFDQNLISDEPEQARASKEVFEELGWL